MNKSTRALTSKTLATVIAKAAEEKKAENITVIPINPEAGIADWFVVCESDNTTHSRAISDGIIDTLLERKQKAWHLEGQEEGNWVVIDYVNVVVHIMTPEMRERYALEKLWEVPKAPRVKKG